MDYSDPSHRPLWMKEPDAELEAAAAAVPVVGAPEQYRVPATDGAPGATVTHKSKERGPEQIKRLGDGRNMKLEREIVFEVPDLVIQGSISKRVQQFWRGPKQLYVQCGVEMTPWGEASVVVVGYANSHPPTLEDLHQVRAAFFGPESGVMYVVPTPEQLPDRSMATLIEMPRSLTGQTPISLATV